MEWTVLGVVWTILSIISTLALGRITHECVKEFRATRSAGTYQQKLIAQLNLVGAASLLEIAVMFLYLGVSALVNPIRWFPEHVGTYLFWLRASLIFTVVQMTVCAMWCNALRIRFNRSYR